MVAEGELDIIGHKTSHYFKSEKSILAQITINRNPEIEIIIILHILAQPQKEK